MLLGVVGKEENKRGESAGGEELITLLGGSFRIIEVKGGRAKSLRTHSRLYSSVHKYRRENMFCENVCSSFLFPF